jgi:hypothetical protein
MSKKRDHTPAQKRKAHPASQGRLSTPIDSELGQGYGLGHPEPEPPEEETDENASE